MLSAKRLAVLIVSQADDPHATLIETMLHGAGVTCVRTCLDLWHEHVVEWVPDGPLRLQVDGANWSVGKATTVWWRRPGCFENAALRGSELELARDETAVILPGALASAGVRWVDEPWMTLRAANRLVQLTLANQLGIPVPETVVTNSVCAAEAFAAEGTVVAKTISNGVGLAPFVDSVRPEDLALVASVPTVLQRLICGHADWRLVTVRDQCFAWRRERSPDEGVDWRSADTDGGRFVAMSGAEALAEGAIAIQTGLGLSFSVQDWIEVGSDYFFLEVNPQGQWLFLDAAADHMGAALARHLRM